MTCLTQPCWGLVVSEIMYHPAGENEALEFIELYNDRVVTEDVSGYAFIDGIQYTFSANTKIPPKSYVVVARDPSALAEKYGIPGVLGPYTGSLSNSGEHIELANANGGVFISFRYKDTFPWPVSSDGTGHSLVLSQMAGDPEEGVAWATSLLIGHQRSE